MFIFDSKCIVCEQHTLAKRYIEILGLGKDSPSAQKLINYRSPKSAKSVSVSFLSIILCDFERALSVYCNNLCS